VNQVDRAQEPEVGQPSPVESGVGGELVAAETILSTSQDLPQLLRPIKQTDMTVSLMGEMSVVQRFAYRIV
jgi:hypothetical protein